jgi:hypothetical protein
VLRRTYQDVVADGKTAVSGAVTAGSFLDTTPSDDGTDRAGSMIPIRSAAVLVRTVDTARSPGGVAEDKVSIDHVFVRVLPRDSSGRRAERRSRPPPCNPPSMTLTDPGTGPRLARTRPFPGGT